MFGISLARISLLTGSSLGGGVGVSATLDLNFRGQGYSAAMAGYTFNQLIDFTRTTAGTYVDSTGKIVSTPASRNLLLVTQELDNGAWTKSGSSITANAVAAPDGTLTADKINEDTSFAEHKASQSATVAAGSVTLSVYAKAAGRGFLAIRENINGTFVNTFFNLATGAVVSTGASRTSSISSVGSGWYRCAVTATSAGGSVNCGFDVSSNGSDVVYTGDGTSGIYVWGAQLEQASAATDYTRNNGGVFPPRLDYDPVTLAPKGLLVEEQRTNLFTYSEQFDNAAWAKTNVAVTANSAASPSGTTTADTLAATSANGTVTQAISTTAIAMTYSVYLKRKTGTGGIQITADGSTWVTQTIDSTNWTRCIVTQTALAGTTSPGIRIVASGDEVFAWGAQYE
jgi:hypothetical protein